MVETAVGTVALVEKTVLLEIQSNDLTFPLEASGLLITHPKGFVGVKGMLVYHRDGQHEAMRGTLESPKCLGLWIYNIPVLHRRLINQPFRILLTLVDLFWELLFPLEWRAPILTHVP